MPPNIPQEQTGGCCRGSALKRLALLESMCQRRSEDFVPPAAQRGCVRQAARESHIEARSNCQRLIAVPAQRRRVMNAQIANAGDRLLNLNTLSLRGRRSERAARSR